MNTADANVDQQSAPLPPVRVPSAASRPDLATILGLILSFALIISAIFADQSNANFINIPSVLIVILGTITATCVAYSLSELKDSLPVIGTAFSGPVRDFSGLAKSMLDITTVGRKQGVLALSAYENQTKNEPFLNYALKLVVDGYNPDDIKRILQQDIDLEEERRKRAASVLRRASEVAPAMGLIGTLVGLVKMLADLDDPGSIGPAMALALLTTFYGAIMGTVVLGPLAAKVEKNAQDEVIMKTMTLKTCLSIVSQENPRNLEMMLNSLLPASQRIRYFD